MNKLTHVFGDKETIVETRKNKYSSRRISRSSKVNESVRRIINFTSSMILSFECARDAGANGIEKKIVQWWGAAVPHFL